MNGAFLHIATNHIPVIAIPFSFVLLLIGIIRKSRELIKVSYVALVVIALITVFVFKTGGPAAGVVHSYPGVQRSDIHEHAEAAEFGFWATAAVGVLSLIGLFLSAESGAASAVAVITLLGALFTSVVMARVAHLGGLIRHPEIRSEATPPAAAPATQK
jgi:hypothetical protein